MLHPNPFFRPETRPARHSLGHNAPGYGPDPHQGDNEQGGHGLVRLLRGHEEDGRARRQRDGRRQRLLPRAAARREVQHTEPVQRHERSVGDHVGHARLQADGGT